MDMFAGLIGWLNGLIWGWVLVYVLVAIGVYFTMRSGFVQIRHFGHTFAVLGRSFKTEHGGISSFGAYCTSLAARVGTGNIGGVAIAITLGGPGAVFWMWVIAFIGMATAFMEATLAQLYKEPGEAGTFRGGPAYYMARGLGLPAMGVAFSAALIFAFGFVFNAVQANSISSAMYEAFGLSPWITGAVVVAVTGFIIFGGVRRIIQFAEIVVPVMAIAYLLVALFVVMTNLGQVPTMISRIVADAFGFAPAVGGAVGAGFAAALTNGVRRGLFSNEAGLGSAPNAAATADVPHPAQQGYVQMLGVFTDTMIVCSSTAFIILLSGIVPDPAASGVTLTQQALSAEVGAWGTPFIAIALLFFAFTSIVANYLYGQTSLLFIKDDPRLLRAFQIAVLAMTMFGAVAKAPLVWDMADVAMGIMALINLAALAMLSGTALRIMRDYNTQLENGVKGPRFDPANHPDLADKLAPGVW